MKQEFNFIKSNTDDREESSWFVLLFFKSMCASFRKELVDEFERKIGGMRYMKER